MEVNEAVKIPIARPVTSRPRCLIYKSFSELLTGAVDISSTNVHSEMTVIAIRPKTVRLKLETNHVLVGEPSSQVGVREAPVVFLYDNILQWVEKPKFLYKIRAKLAPRKTISLLENKPQPQPLKQNLSDGHGRTTICNDTSNETNNPAWRNQNPQKSIAYFCRIENPNDGGLTIHSSKVPCFYDPIAAARMHTAVRNSEDSAKGSRKLKATYDEPKTKIRKIKVPSSRAGTSGESTIPYIANQRTTDSEIIEDGFCWRKYGQKVMKGSLYPR
ncbi:hypothetical protein BC332_28339 [Capsicum chinense]|nr:hypothetical protein BC332_28339 [Capsicum chinense]